jgi:multidrug efflux pump
MTSLAFILGVVPLILSVGAGAEMRRTLGTAVFSGMLGVTLFGLVLTPVFFFTVDWLGETRVFQWPFVKRFGEIAMDTLTLRKIRRMTRDMVKRLLTMNKSPTNGASRNGQVPHQPAEPERADSG